MTALSRLELASLFTAVADLIPDFTVAPTGDDRAARQFINTLDPLPVARRPSPVALKR